MSEEELWRRAWAEAFVFGCRLLLAALPLPVHDEPLPRCRVCGQMRHEVLARMEIGGIEVHVCPNMSAHTWVVAAT